MNSKRIVLKNCDRWFSSVHEGKLINEYLIYVMEGDVVIQTESKMVGTHNERIGMMNLLEELLGDDFSEANITQLSFDEYQAQNKELI